MARVGNLICNLHLMFLQPRLERLENCMHHARENAVSLKKYLEGDFAFMIQDVAAHNCLNGDLINRKSDKGLGIKRICKTLGVDIKDTYGFGDSINDLEMIETVGTSVVMENGSEVLKRMADVIAPSVTEDGIYRSFEELGLI
jgi:hydroxymethylpyrimidine pyrophosphatase-like HAD family hydrolase